MPKCAEDRYHSEEYAMPQLGERDLVCSFVGSGPISLAHCHVVRAYVPGSLTKSYKIKDKGVTYRPMQPGID